MCLLVAMWFISGVVMMYVGFPQLTRAERLAALCGTGFLFSATAVIVSWRRLHRIQKRHRGRQA